MPTHQIVTVIGVILLLTGGIPGAMGTTNTGLFVVYGALVVGGILLLGLAKKLKDRA